MKPVTMPVLFFGHGSPMNALAENSFTESLRRARALLPATPKAVLAISAHWVTKGTQVTSAAKPRTIHDFYGFPPELFAVQYPAPGSPELAARLTELLPHARLDEGRWGFDHGSWALLRYMFPEADVPVVQLSLEEALAPQQRIEMGARLAPLREEGVLILASGNIVHNLRTIRWEDDAPSFDWAVEFDMWVKEKLLARDIASLAQDRFSSEAGGKSVPTPDHFWPLHYALGAARASDRLEFLFEGLQNGSISMRSFAWMPG